MADKLGDKTFLSLLSESNYIVVFRCCRNITTKQFHPFQDIIEHKKIKHSKKFPFICNTCGEVFSRNQQFQIHVKIHERDSKNAKSWTCPQCNEKFTKKFLYRKHLQLSKHEDMRICEQCGSQFNDNIKLNQHISVI